MKTFVILLAALTIALGGVADAHVVRARPLPSPSSDDAAVIARIVMSAVTEMRLCELAVQKSHTPDIIGLCRVVSSDASRTALAGMQLAQSIGANPATLQPFPNTPALLESLGRLSGHEFDREFLLTQIDADENDEHAVRYAVEVADTESVRRYEYAVLRNVDRHLAYGGAALRHVAGENP